jgi:hypothetical protein
MNLRRPFSFGTIELPSNIFCAPLAGCSDLPFRLMTNHFRPGLLFCEMVKIEALIRNSPRTLRFLDYTPEMHPIGAQICGSKPAVAAAAAKIIEDLGFDVIDLNCGCPVGKVVKDGSGSGLLRNPERIGEMISAIASSVKIPVTINRPVPRRSQFMGERGRRDIEALRIGRSSANVNRRRKRSKSLAMAMLWTARALFACLNKLAAMGFWWLALRWDNPG